MATVTTVEFSADHREDTLTLNGKLAPGIERTRVVGLLDRVRHRAGLSMFASVESTNDFPTASGLASSASAFAALATSASAAAGLALTAHELSDLARRTSVSAARSLFGGFVELRAGTAADEGLSAEVVAPADHWDIAIVVAVTREGAKDIGSSEGMKQTSLTSPYYDAWVERAPRLFSTIRGGIVRRDLSGIGPAVEQSALMMHAAALAGDPALLYFSGSTVNAIHAVRTMRKEGLEGYLTIDAGPHVKVLTRGSDAQRVSEYMSSVPGVLRTIIATPGEAARLVP